MTTHYFIGTEDIHFVAFGSPGFSVGAHRTAWSRGALGTFTSAGIDRRWRAPLPSNPVSVSNFWLTCRFSSAIILTTKWFRFLSGAAQERLSLSGKSAGLPILERLDDDETVTTLATGTDLPWPSGGAVGKIDIHVNIDTGVFRVYNDYSLILDAAVDLTNGEYDAITGFELSGDAGFSEVVWQDTDTRDIIGVRSIWPYAAGNAAEWTGTKDDVDEEEVNMSDANFTATVDLVQKYAIQPLPADLSDNVTVGAVMLGIRMLTDPTDEAILIETGGSDFLSSSYDTSGLVADRSYIWESNPNTLAGWTKDEINDVNFNIGARST